MINIVVLQDTLNPVSAAERVKVNQNWDAIRRGFSSIQNQIAFLSGGEDVDAIIQRIENAITLAEQGAQTAIDNVNNNYAERVVEINQALSDLSTALDNAANVTQATEAERLLTVQATTEARSAIDQLTSIVNDLRSLGEYNSNTAYKRNNLVSLDGRTYIALQDNTNQPVTNSSYWALFADRGQDGQRGPQGEAGSSLNIIDELNLESELPNVGNPGDAYTIGGDLYVWSAERAIWVNVGPVKGEKGDQGEKGDSGYYQLANFQYVINPTVNGQTTIEIPLVSFDVNNHSLTLFRNGVAQDPTTYSIVGRNITLNEAVSDFTQTSFYLMITQGVLVQPRDTIDGNVIVDGTIGFSKLGQDVVDAINSSTGMATNVAGLNREVAYLKLRQEASERIEGGTVFADDFNGSRFGFTLNETDSVNIAQNDGKLLMLEQQTTNFAADSQLVATGSYNVMNNSGKKMTTLLNGWIVSAASTTDNIFIYVNKNDGNGFNQLCFFNDANINAGDYSLSSYQNNVHLIFNYNNAYVASYNFDALTVTNVNQYVAGTSRYIESTAQTRVGNLSIATNYNNGTLHATWLSRTTALNVSLNIRYATSSDNGVTWQTPEQLTNYNAANTNCSNPTINISDGIPVITFQLTIDNTYSIRSFRKEVAWNGSLIYDIISLRQVNPSSVVGADGVIHLTWSGLDEIDDSALNIRYSRSSDGGSTWSEPEKLTQGNVDRRGYPSITVDKKGSVFIIYNVYNNMTIKQLTMVNGVWSEPITIYTNSVSIENYQAVIFDPYYKYDFTIAPVLYVGNNDIRFSANYNSVIQIPSLSSTLVYNIAHTDYVGAFVKKIGNVNVIGYLNGNLMDSNLENNEYSFESSLSIASEATLMLQLSRNNISGGNNDALTRILGGRS